MSKDTKDLENQVISMELKKAKAATPMARMLLAMAIGAMEDLIFKFEAKMAEQAPKESGIGFA